MGFCRDRFVVVVGIVRLGLGREAGEVDSRGIGNAAWRRFDVASGRGDHKMVVLKVIR